MSGVRIMNFNFLDTDVVSQATVSSEQAAFPVSNIYVKQRRSKVWRSNGFWEIEAGSNTITFRETVGVDLVATVAAGTYASDTLFFAALKAAFEAPGAATYTISRETGTNKIKIASNLGGGATVFQIYWTSSTAMAGILGFNASLDDTGASNYIADVLRIHTSEWIKWDMGISSNPQAFILIGPRNSPIKISPSATLFLQGNETDSWANPSYEVALTYNDYVIAEVNSAGLHTEALRYWRLQIEDQNPLGYVEIGAVFLGTFFEATRGAVQFPLSIQQIDRSVTETSEGGQTFSDARPKTEAFDLSWFGLTSAEKEDLDQFILDFGTAFPFFVQLDPSAAFSVLDDYYIRYVKLVDPPAFELVSPGVWSCEMSLREEL